MSTTPRFSLQDKERRRSSSFHGRSDSGELDVFEAERYFSAASESLPQKIGALSTRQFASLRQGRASLDMPMIMRHTQQEILLDTIKPTKEKKKHKQPSSPGGKLASFFNSLINQTVSKKKKSTSKSVKDIVDQEDNSPGGWRRKRRSSISHFSSSTTTTRSTSKTTVSEVDSKSTKSCSSGFRTPPPYIISLPIKPYKEFKAARPTLEKHYSVSKDSDFYYKAGSEKRINWVDRIIPEAAKESRDFKRFNMEEDGAESDSSSDLFELQLNNHHHHHHHHKLGYFASDLPVYESTHLDTIKISSGTPITNGPFRN